MDDRNGLSNRIDFQSYKKLTVDERDFFIFDTLCRIDERTATIDSRFAAKWVETVMKSGIGVTLIGVLGAILAMAGIHIKGN